MIYTFQSVRKAPTIDAPIPPRLVRCPNCGSAVSVLASGLALCSTCAIAVTVDTPPPPRLALDVRHAA